MPAQDPPSAAAAAASDAASSSSAVSELVKRAAGSLTESDRGRDKAKPGKGGGEQGRAAAVAAKSGGGKKPSPGGGSGGSGVRNGSPSKKRARVVGGGGPGGGVEEGDAEPGEAAGTSKGPEKGVSDTSAKLDPDEPRPFAPLPFFGDHKRAVSSLSFAPSSSPALRGHRGGASLNSNADPGIVAGAGRGPVAALCASASADGSAKIWDVPGVVVPEGNGTTIRVARRSDGITDQTPHQLAPPKGAMMSTVTQRLWSRIVLLGHGRGINDVAWSPSGAYLATASDDRTLRLWSAETGDALVEFRGHTNFVFSCSFNPQSNLLASASFDETVKLWDVRCGECVATLPAHSNPVTGVDFNRDGTCIVSGSYDGLVRIWDTATGECLKTVYAEGNPPVGCVRFSPNGKFVLSGTLDGKLRLYDVSGGRGRGGGGGGSGFHGGGGPQPRGGRCAKTYAGHVNSRYCAFASFLAANPKRRCVVSGSEDGKVYLYDLQTRLVRQALGGHDDAVLAVDAHDSLELIASGGMARDKYVRFWAPLGTDD
ncbi:hypothetical protein ACHAWF_005141 [Thalassiosira exigua]